MKYEIKIGGETVWAGNSKILADNRFTGVQWTSRTISPFSTKYNTDPLEQVVLYEGEKARRQFFRMKKTI